MWKSKSIKTLVAALCLLICFQGDGFSRENATLSDIVVTNNRDDLLLYLKVNGAFREKMKRAILSGVPTTFSYYITLSINRGFWPDKKIADIKVTHTIKYDSLKKEFSVKRSWETNGEPLVTRSFEEAQRDMTKIAGLKIIPLARLERGRRYRIRVKAELNKITLPFYLHYVLFFVSLWDFETDWYTIDFTY